MRRGHVALTVSIVLNLFLASALVAGYLSLKTGNRVIVAGSLTMAGDELPSAERKEFRRELRSTRREMLTTIAGSVAAKVDAASLLRQPSVDQPAVLRALERARLADVSVRKRIESRAVAFAASLPPAQRTKIADAMERRARNALPSGE